MVVILYEISMKINLIIIQIFSVEIKYLSIKLDMLYYIRRVKYRYGDLDE